MSTLDPLAVSTRGTTAVGSATSSHRPQLDTIRAVALLVVLYAHFRYAADLPFTTITGDNAVRVFFTLSGFLITDILLRLHNSLSSDNRGTMPAIVAFWIRRILRVWPAYYLLLFAELAVNIADIRSDAIWHLTFTSNVLFALHPDKVDITGHLWSLAVEEQFYLIWPLIVLFTPRQYLVRMCGAVTVIGLCCRFISSEFDTNEVFNSLPITECDSIGAGALLAAARWYAPGPIALVRRVAPYAFVGACVFYVLQGEESFLADELFTIATAGLIDIACDGFKGRIGQAFEWRPLVYLGKISYGVYLYHIAVYTVFDKVWIRLFDEEGFGYGVMQLFVAGAASIAVAMVSWNLIEKPFNSLKERFRYDAKGRLASSSASTETAAPAAAPIES